MKREDWLDAKQALLEMWGVVRTMLVSVLQLFAAVILLCAFIWGSYQMYMNYPLVTCTLFLSIPIVSWFRVQFAIAREQRVKEEQMQKWREEFCKPAHEETK